MKLAFTTLGCPAWDLETILTKAVALGFQGVDFRGYLGEMAVYQFPEFAADREATARRIADAGLELSCFSSGVGLMDGETEANLEEFRAYAALCPVFGTRHIRVFGKAIGDLDWEQAIDAASGTLGVLAGIAGDHGAKVLVETHDAWVDSSHVRALMERTGSPHAGVLWDIHHPWRAGESPAETWAALGPWIENTHWKDATLPDHALCLMGEGALPLVACVEALRDGGYAGYYTLEWEKRWHPELADPEVAFPGYVEAMCALAGG